MPHPSEKYEVTLEPGRLAIADARALTVFERRKACGSPHKYGFSESPYGPTAWGNMLRGRRGEAALNQLMGLDEPTDEVDWTPNDVADFDVKTTHHETGHLIVHDALVKKHPDQRFALVIELTRARRYRCVGWLTGSDMARGWKPHTRRGDDLAYWIPQLSLRPFEVPSVAPGPSLTGDACG